MAQSVIGALRVNLGLDSAQFERGARRMRDPIQNMRRQFMAVSAAAAAMGAALSLAVRSGLQDVDRVAKAARTIDGTTGALRALELAGSDAGVSQQEVTQAAQRMTREIARAAREGGRGADALNRLGLEASELAELDADERMATIADRIRELGLSSGQTMDLLRDLGVRSEEMANLLTRGGGAIRAARREVDDLGLALDDNAVRQIERTNDALSRIGLAFQAFRNRLAASVAPALEGLANAFVDLMREGGALRRVLDGLADNIQRVGSYVTAAVTLFGTRYVAALVAARVATMSFAGALAFLRGALIRTGVGALVVGLGEAIYQFGRLVEATGSFGEALEVMGEVAREVLTERVPLLAGAMLSYLRARWEQMKADWLSALDEMLSRFRGWAESIGGVLKMVPGFQGFGIVLEELANASDGFGTSIARLEHESDRFDRIGAGLANAAMKPLKALEGLKDSTKGVGDETDEAADAARRFGEALDGLGGAGGGAGGGGGGGSIGTATTGMDTFRDSLQQTNQVMDRLRSGMSNAFASIVTGAQSAREAIGQLLQQMAQMLANRAFTRLFDSIFGAIGGGASLGGGSWNIGGFNVPSLDFGAAAAAPAVPSMSPSPAMAPAASAAPARGGGPSQAVQVEVLLRDEMLDARIVGGAGRVVKQHERKVLPKTMQNIQRNPRDIG